MRLGRFAVVFVDEQGRHEKDTALGHAFEMARVFVEIAAMFDRIDPRVDRNVEPAAAQRVAHDPPVEGVRLVDQRLHLVKVEGAVARPVARPGAGAAGRRAFDHVGAGPHHPAHHRPHIGERIDDALRQQRIARDAAAIVERQARRTDRVTDAADRRDDRQGQHQARPVDQPFLDRALEPSIEPGGVADHRVAGGERLSQHRRGAQVTGALGLIEAPAMLQRIPVVRHVVVAIDQARQHRHSGDIDDFGFGRPVALVAGGDRVDTVAADHDCRTIDRRGAGAIDQPRVFQDLHCVSSLRAPTPALPRKRGRESQEPPPIALPRWRGKESAAAAADG